MKLKGAIPNAITSGNMFFGLGAIIIALQPFYFIEYAFWCILLAATCDLLDGMVARALNAQSEFGKQFDSLCDIVSFGVAPAMITVAIVRKYSPAFEINDCISWIGYIPPAIFALTTGIRLALFNIDTRQTKSFLGLPSPAAGLFLVCTSLFWAEFYGAENVLFILSAVSLLFSALMLIPIPLLSVKLHDKQSLVMAIVLILVAIPMFIFLGWAAVSPIILIYLLASPIIQYFSHFFRKSKTIIP